MLFLPSNWNQDDAGAEEWEWEEKTLKQQQELMQDQDSAVGKPAFNECTDYAVSQWLLAPHSHALAADIQC